MQPNQHSQPKFTNHLANELSPYLLQHAHNPVNWYPWSEEALNKAKTEDKPILISIGYAACHWCHVMEREAFENEEIAQYMNQHFVNIKVDREERPDLDNIYMDAVTTLTGSGGWPLNCFLTPEAKPFYGGTYFPPKPMYGKPDWLSLLKSIVRTFAEKRTELEQQAEQLTQHILQQDTVVFQNVVVELNAAQLFEPNIADTIYLRLKQRFDTEDGGFGAAPKFPGTMNLQWLLQYHYFSGEKGALQHTLFSLDKMTDGGIYDHLGGGFSRYSVDKAWLVPHFEKMLYDNALLIDLLSDAYKITQKPEYKETLEQTLSFIAREMTNSEGGFYSSYDADSEGEEGKYYVWSKKEIEQILSDDAPIFNRFFGVTENGNWEGKNILNRQFTYKTFADKTGYSTEQLKNLLQRCRRRLIAHRDDRIKPALDDKILLGWNALMTTAYANAYEALGNEDYKKAAETNLQFMLTKFATSQNSPALLHTHKNGRAQYPAFLDDYAFLIEALLAVYQINFDEKLPQLALTYTEFVEQHFTDASGSAILFYTPDFQTDIIARKKEYYDSATPSGNATMAANLKLLGTILNRPDFIEKSAQMLKSIETSVLKYPSSFGKWGSVMLQFIYPSREVAVLGNNAPQLANQLSKSYLPNLALMAATHNRSPYELLQDRYVEGKNLIYVCENNTCKMPVSQPDEALKLIDGRLK